MGYLQEYINKGFSPNDLVNELQRLVNKNFVTVVYTVNKQTDKDNLINKGVCIFITDNLY